MIAMLSVVLFASTQPMDKPVTPLRRAHAHNDYEHLRPLLDAIDQGFCSVEADVWLSKGSLLVAHTPFGLKSERTLQKLYLDPLRERAKANGGKVHREGPPFYLLIDVKTEAKTTYAELATVLEGYSDILSAYRKDQSETKAVTVVISGNCDRDGLMKQAVRYAAIDGRPADLDSETSTTLIPWVSTSWKSQFKWDGTGVMPKEERVRLKEFVTKAHSRGRLVRFWATPEKPELWKELLMADVDLINTDNLVELRAFLVREN